MTGYCSQLHRLKERYDCDLVYAGDLFHTWREPAELVNWAIKHLPRGYAVPGQHDLPNHRYDEVRRSPYWTLVEAGALENLPPDQYLTASGGRVMLHGFPWGSAVRGLADPNKRYLNVAVVHAYVWLGPNKYPDAPPKQHFSKYVESLEGYDAAVFGDNHYGFAVTAHKRDGSRSIGILNNGCFIPRSADERERTPHAGLVYADGSVERMPFDDSQDKWLDEDAIAAEPAADPDLEQLMTLLKASRHKADFAKVLARSLEASQLRTLTRMVILQALEDVK